MALASTAPICAASTQVHILVKRDLLCLPVAVIWPYHLYDKGMANDARGVPSIGAKVTSLHASCSGRQQDVSKELSYLTRRMSCCCAGCSCHGWR